MKTLANSQTYYTLKDDKDVIIEKIKQDKNQYGFQVKGSNKNQFKYWNRAVSFDIETTNTTTKSGEKFAFMYEWSFALGDFVIIGREWSEFKELLDLFINILGLHEKKNIIIYVHNLAFEFQFMRTIFSWSSIFARKKREPMYARTTSGIEFRDSLVLSGLSLDKTAQNLTKHKIKKLIGDLDYTKIRTCKTPLSDDELAYCANDVLIVTAYIEECIEECNGSIVDIPLTNTGRVRKYCRKHCLTNEAGFSNKEYQRLMKTLTLTPFTYQISRDAFSGGFTHANAMYYNMVMEKVTSMDFTSSYPAVMLMEQFPMSSFTKVQPKYIQNKYDLQYYLDLFCCIMSISFKNIRLKSNVYDCPLSYSKCKIEGECIKNNGRIDRVNGILTTTITNVDYEVITKFYDCDGIRINHLYTAKKGYLPLKLIECILYFYNGKTTLKDVEDKKAEYQLLKGMLNSLYGMCVYDVLHDEILYIDDNWACEKIADVDTFITEYNEDKKRFIYYPWGVFITAYARRNLFTAIYELGGDYIYSDTDSVKFINVEKHQNYFDAYNKVVDEKLQKMCKFYNIDFEQTRPQTIKGKIKPIGYWDFDGYYEKFKTLGAKRYLTKKIKDGKAVYSITVSGLRKEGFKNMQLSTISDEDINEAKAEHSEDYEEYVLNNCVNDRIFDIFDDNLSLNEDESGVLIHTYIDDKIEEDITDYMGTTEHVISNSAVHLSKSSYSLSVTGEYIRYVTERRDTKR